MPPPENDSDAIKLGNKIRQWIKQGRLEPGQSKTDEDTEEEIDNDEENDDDKDDDIQKHDKEEKPKKKRGMFGFFRK